MDKMNGLDFNRNMSVKEFSQHYWYKEELKRICIDCKIPSHGTKAELESKIKNYLSGKKVGDNRQKVSNIRKGVRSTKITVATKLIPEGFKFNQTAREFFANYYNVPKFKFTKEMASALREAERQGDLNMTVGDLIKIYEKGKNGEENHSIISPEEKTYQWNNFVRDFNKDTRTQCMKNKMKIAAFLWNYVKTNPGPKEYNEDLLDQFYREVEKISNAKK
ncbi:SAP domain-containing protein [Virgibacillus sp. AGTR]|uniref:SAP domain-containing protein n=1 Tax=Virgibacillus sp. AGTR TaxID=2812055 RepID=UPI001D16341F|nr:SAP domain-containing protein [Virgibacillus sp. AGTR]MCC2252734.1 SAP domain-containing protein [Virgibacillus sp. AGTR]